MNIRFSKLECELIYKILVRVKAKYHASLSSNYNWINIETLDSLIKRFKFNLNDAQIKEMEND
jgi:DNA polymerase III delta prime subunit